ncbi:MAG: PaaI family thioesterase [Desulfovibrionaceae bacterium]|nr:PaaI family thioesterase [Desulfovibrionaceae bacterium]
MMNAVAERDKVLRLMNMSILELRHGYAKVSMPLADSLKNGMGFAHGGTIFSIADIAFGAAANEDSEHFVVTLNTSIEYLSPGVTGPLIAEARLIREGKRIKNYEVLVYDGQNTLIARAMTTGYATTAIVE